jgi:hypothetical protein
MYQLEEFKNDYYNYATIDEMKQKYNISQTTYFTILKRANLQRRTTKLNRILGSLINNKEVLPIEKSINKPMLLDKPKSSNNIVSFGNVDKLYNNNEVKAVYHKPVKENNIEIIKKDLNNNEKIDELDKLLDSANNTINNVNSKKIKKMSKNKHNVKN